MQKFFHKLLPVCCDGADEVTEPSRFSIVKSEPSSSTRNDSAYVTQQSDWLSNDEYGEIKELTSGSQGRTCLTRSLTTNKVYVVKQYTSYVSHYHGHGAMAIDRHNRLPDEARVLLNALSAHPNIIRLFGADYWPVHKANLYMEYCSGGDLSDQLTYCAEQRRAPPEVFVLHVFVSLVQAFMYLHHGLVWDDEHRRYWQQPGRTAIVHGDIKCENIFLRWSENPERRGLPDVVLGDFGAAAVASHAVGITGTSGYEAPEVRNIYNFESFDLDRARVANALIGVMTPATDVYSFGQVIMRTTTARFHVCGADPLTRPRRVGREIAGVALPEEFQKPEGLTMAMQWCLMVDPSLRPEMSTRQGAGIKDLVGHLREVRDKLLLRDRPLRRRTWASPPGNERA